MTEKVYPFNAVWAVLWLFAAAATLLVKTEAMLLYTVGFVLLPTIVVIALGSISDIEKAWTEIDFPYQVITTLAFGFGFGYVMYFFFTGGLWAQTATIIENILSVFTPLVDSDLDGVSDIFDSAPHDKFTVLYEPMTQGNILTSLVTSQSFAVRTIGTLFAQIFIVGFGEEYLARLSILSLLKKTKLNIFQKLIIVGLGFSLLHFAVYPSVLGAYLAAFIGGIALAIFYMVGGLAKAAVAHGTYNTLLIMNLRTGMVESSSSGFIMIVFSLVIVGSTLYFLNKAMKKSKVF